MTEASAGLALLRWYRRNRRDLPWRRSGDPYAVWLSEVMLQQTTVKAAAPRWRRFLARFPGVTSLAGAREREVLAEWAGLGYYARARNLHRAAKAIARAGVFPRTVEGWRALPGVGEYTAAAVASICFGVPAPAVDGNAVRVLVRLHALRLDPRSASAGARLRRLAAGLLVRRRPGESNQALMELGATLCTPRAPRCPLCPLRDRCEAFRRGTPEAFPRTRRRKPSRPIHLVAAVAYRRGKILLVEDRELVRGHLTVPLFRVPAGRRPEDVLRRQWGLLSDRQAGALDRLTRLRHAVLDRSYLVDVFILEEAAPSPLPRSSRAMRRRGTRPVGPPRVRLLAVRDLGQHAHGGLLVKILRLLGDRARRP